MPGKVTHWYSNGNPVGVELSLAGGGRRGLVMDAAMQLVRERFETGRPVRRSVEVQVKEPGPFNYHCAECSALLIRHAGKLLPDVIVICPVCLSLNEAAGTYRPLPTRRA